MTSEFGPGAEVTVTLSGRVSDADDQPAALYCEPRGFFDASAFQQLVDAGCVQPATPEAYDPHDGDEVEVTVRGRVRAEGPELTIEGVDPVAFAYARIERQVRLVSRAAPVYEPGIYVTPSGQRWVLYPDGGCAGAQPWLCLDPKPRESMWHGWNDIPTDLVPCVVVPTGEA